MSITADVHTSAPTQAAQRQSVWKHGLAAAIVASVTTTSLAAIASAAGVSFADNSGADIPIAGFTTLTVVFSLVGVVLAGILARTARHPQSTFVRTALVLVVLSYIPDLTYGFDARSAVVLIALHSVAAAIVVPTLARRLARTR
jgi:hypothetical protein